MHGHICVCSASWGNLLSWLGLHTPCRVPPYFSDVLSELQTAKWSWAAVRTTMMMMARAAPVPYKTAQQPRVAHAGRMNNEWCRLCLVKSVMFIRYNGPLHLNNRIYMRLALEPVICRKSSFFPGGFSQPRARAPCRRLSGAKESVGNK